MQKVVLALAASGAGANSLLNSGIDAKYGLDPLASAEASLSRRLTGFTEQECDNIDIHRFDSLEDCCDDLGTPEHSSELAAFIGSVDASVLEPVCEASGFGCVMTAVLAPYPGYTPGYAVEGTVTVTKTSLGIKMSSELSGLETTTDGGIHIHTGTSCAVAAAVGGHLYYAEDNTCAVVNDPWVPTDPGDVPNFMPSVWTSDAADEASVDLDYTGFTTCSGSCHVNGRAVVVHASTGQRIACGVLQPACVMTAVLDTYPGYTGSISVAGTVTVMKTAKGIKLSSALSGLEDSATGGIHIHSGTSCSDAALVGGHYYSGDTGGATCDVANDPWVPTDPGNVPDFESSTWSSDGSGAATVNIGYTGFTDCTGNCPVDGKAVVVHAADGTKIACGLLTTA
jgi:Cu/Zn superoxide dismutase